MEDKNIKEEEIRLEVDLDKGIDELGALTLLVMALLADNRILKIKTNGLILAIIVLIVWVVKTQ